MMAPAPTADRAGAGSSAAGAARTMVMTPDKLQILKEKRRKNQ